MLAQNFKPAADLGITDSDHDALIKLLAILERGEVRHVEIKDGTCVDPAGEFTGAFNMANIYTAGDCGTAACMAGTCDWLLGTKFAPGGYPADWPETLHDLFCPDAIEEKDWNTITVPQAASALRNYLTLGQPCWDEVLG